MNPTRREMLRISLGSAALVSLGGTIPAFLSNFAFAEKMGETNVSNDNILVVVQFSGGNDGLNTVVPVGNDSYLKARKVIGIKDGLHRLDDGLALNPGMKAFKELYDEGKLAVINGCGYPEPNRSHFRSMEIWHTADPKTYQPVGWLGHYIDHALRGTDSPMKAVNIGPELPQALVSDSAPVPSIQSVEDFQVKTDSSSHFDAKLERDIIRDLNAVRESSPSMQFFSRQATNAILATEQVRKLTAGYKADAEYQQGFGQQLRLIAQIIAANFGTRLFYCQVGGFDTHANQVNGHQQLLQQVSSAIAAFHKDIGAKGYGEKVTLMCFSEFGRRVTQNDSNGTDHGAAGPMFVSGANVKGGLYGAYPSLTDLDDGDLKFTTDFRRVYATVLQKWLNVDAMTVLKEKYEPLAFL
jgi:uncharacterized protein (DUF1501 family)